MTDAVPAAEHRLIQRLVARGWSLAVAESLTGGWVTSSLVAVPGASACLRGGLVAYATDLKHSLLGVDADLLAAEGPVHPEVARQMALGVRELTRHGGVGADVGLATTGVAGPATQGGRPVGTVYIAVATPLTVRVEALALDGTREQIRSQATRRALELALDEVR
ncbi:CinA family protein [Microbacterium sp. zg.B48]|uniref:CinA family protein n=1 Tax=Microbacterium sp. zg.B48 TaxID=2969408 RepID=UPI00214B33BA|nr:CinA family protein [Microbacterium sp. zg.B48]MCR2764843.1 CinA family protein [Microbacterium sp. zg.B48]